MIVYKYFPFTVLMLIVVSTCGWAHSQLMEDEAVVTAQVTRNITSMPLAFTENRGQWGEEVLFRANAGGATMWFTSDGTYYQFIRPVPEEREITDSGGPTFDLHVREPQQYETMMIKASFVGANPNPQMSGADIMEYKCNYFIGNEPDNWRTDVPNYQAVIYEEVYAGIDLKYYGNGREMEYDFIVSPGADYGQIEITYEGAHSVSINDSGDLVIATDWGEVIERCPSICQIDGGSRRSLSGKYKKTGDNSFGFELSEEYDTTLALVIDPVLVYSTYLGGSTYEQGHDITVDGFGCAYITGETYSPDFPTQGAFQENLGGSFYPDIFISKLNNAGDGLIYSTYLGGGSYDYGWGIAIDESGCAYVTGQTESNGAFPTTQGAFRTSTGEYLYDVDAFVTKLSEAGNSLIYSTFLGGYSNHDFGFDIAVDASGCAYVTGGTQSSDFPTQVPIQLDQDSEDAFVTKLNADGTGLIYSTYLGGNNFDQGGNIVVDGIGCVFVTGYTDSDDFPMQNAFQPYLNGTNDAFIAKISSTGDNLIYSTYLGGSEYDHINGIAVDTSSCAYVVGYTLSTDFPIIGPYQIDQGRTDVFVTKLNKSGDNLIYSTYLGGCEDESGGGIVVDNSGCAYVTGTTWSSDFPTKMIFQNDQDYEDVFVTKINGTGDELIYSTYLGGSWHDTAGEIAIDESGAVYITGMTESLDFPIYGELQLKKGARDAFITKLIEQRFICGDASGDGTVNIADASYIINYIFFSGPTPDPIEAGDASNDGNTNIADASYLINWIFFGGNAPCEND